MIAQEYKKMLGAKSVIREMFTYGTERAKEIGKDGAVRDLELELNGVTEAEKKVLLAGSLINSYKEA